MRSSVEAVFLSATNLEKSCIQVYDIFSGALIRSYKGTSVSPNSLCVIGSNEVLCGQKDKPRLQAWSGNQIESTQVRCSFPGKLNVLTVSQSGDKLCGLGVGGKIFIYDLKTGLKLGLINRHYQDVTCLEFTSCGNYLASAGEDGFVYLWSKFRIIESLHKLDSTQFEPYYQLGQHSDKVTDLCISGVGTRGILVTSSLDHSAKVFDLSTGHLRCNLIGNCALTCCEVNSIGTQVFLAGKNGRAWVINLLLYSTSQNIQIEEKGILCHDSAVNYLALTSDCNNVLTGSVNGEVKLWSVNMQESKNSFSNPSLALQQTFFVGKGAITNLMIKKLDLEDLNSSDRESLSNPPQFCVDTTDNGLDAPVPFFPFQHTKENFQTEEHLRLASQLFSKQKKAEKSSKKRKTEPNQSGNDDLSETDLVACMQTLKKSNKNLYDFCVKHVLGDS